MSARATAVGVALLVLCVPLPSDGSAPESRPQLTRLGGMLEIDTAWDTRRGRAQKLELVLQPELVLRLRGWRFTTVVRLRGDVYDRLDPGARTQHELSQLSRSWMLGDNVDLELREAHVQGTIGPLSLTAGKQQIVWGTADGLKVLDLVNPQTFREFILDDFEDSRIPLWGLLAEAPAGPVWVQVVWLPDQSYHELPEPDGVFAFTSPRFAPPPPPGVPVVIRNPSRPQRVLADSDAGARLRWFAAGFDLTLNYLYHYDDRVIPFRELSAVPGTVVVQPRYERTHLLGGTLSRAIGDFVVRSEVAWSSNRFLPTAEPTDRDGVVETSELASVLGLDWWGIRDTLISGQVLQSWLPAHSPALFRDELDASATLLVRRTLLRERLTAEAIAIQSINDGDGLARLRLRYDLRDWLELQVGLDVLYGSRHGVFGQYDARDRVTLRLRWRL